MRVALVLNVPPNDHRAVYAHGIAKALVKKGHEVSVILQRGDGPSREFEEKPYRTITLGGKMYTFLGQLRFMIELLLYLRKKKLDIVHGRNPFSSVIPALILRKLGHSHAGIVYDIRGLWIDIAYLTGRIGALSYRFLSLIEDFCVKGADRIIAISDLLKQVLIRRGVRPQEIEVVLGDGVDLDEFRIRSRAEKNAGPLRIGYVGSISLYRKIDEVLMAFRLARNASEIDMNLVLVGPTEDDFEQILDLVKSLGLERCVQFTGPLPHRDALKQMSGLDVALSYDSYDVERWLPYTVAVHTKVLEYMAAGVPIVATRHPANEAILRDGIDAMLTEESPHDFAEGILQLIRNPALGKELSENALKTVIIHDFAKKAELVEQTYTRALKE